MADESDSMNSIVSMNKEEPLEVLELLEREIGGARCLETFASHNADADVSLGSCQRR